jgi:uncharacterized protein (DUF302 family)
MAAMAYYILKSKRGDFDAVVSAVTQKLEQEGFGVLTEIDVADTLKRKLGVEMPRYRILGACNPDFAQKALGIDDKIGVLLPCNIVVEEKGDREIDVFAIDPRVAMRGSGNTKLEALAEEAALRLNRVVASI